MELGIAKDNFGWVLYKKSRYREAENWFKDVGSIMNEALFTKKRR
jgi:Tfp pilus assembly protein PilF